MGSEILEKCGSWLLAQLILGGGRTGGINRGLRNNESELFLLLTGQSRKFLGFL